MKLPYIIFQSILIIAFAPTSFAQSALDLIRQEGTQRSEVMESLTHLSEIYGQRLTGSHEYLEAARWTRRQLEGWGVDKVEFEQFCNDCRGWSLKSFNVEMVSPYFLKIMAYPMAMSESTPGVVSGGLVHIADRKSMDAVRKQFAGKLKNMIVLLGTPAEMHLVTRPHNLHVDDSDLRRLTALSQPSQERTTFSEYLRVRDEAMREDADFLEFLKSEDAIALFTAESNVVGVVKVEGSSYYRKNDIKLLPWFSIAPDHFMQMLRMIDRAEEPVVSVELRAGMYDHPLNNVNIIAEIPGIDDELRSEVVMLGTHFDSWHAGAGANGASGVAVLMEVLRIIKGSGVPLKRTIRVAFWGGKEQGHIGSKAYGEQHYGKEQAKGESEAGKVSAYLNVGANLGAIRGIYLQGNANARNILMKALEPFNDDGPRMVTIQNALQEDHAAFDDYNIPSLALLLDPGYQSLTHNSTLDIIQYAAGEDVLKNNSVILAAIALHLLNSDDLLPRKNVKAEEEGTN